MSNYTNKLKERIKRKVTKYNLTNDDLHDLFHLYDLLEYYDYYENKSYYDNQLKQWKEELTYEQKLQEESSCN